MSTIKAVINDVDGNIVKSEEACWLLENEIFGLMGIPPMTREIHQQTWGIHLDLGDAAAKRSNGAADPKEFWKLFEPTYNERVKAGLMDIVTEEDLVACAKFRQMGLQHFVLTSRSAVEMSHFMDPKAGLAQYVDHFYHKDNMEFHKPDPRAFAHIEREHGLKPSECVYVGDQPGDAAAAKGAGLHFIANLEEGIRSKEDFADYEVDAFIDKFADLPATLRKLYHL